MRTYAHTVLVDARNIDFMGHVNNSVYLNWVQDAVVEHWRSVAPAWAQSGHLWIALRHDIVYRRPAFLGESVSLDVTLERVRGARAFYDTAILRAGDLLARVASCWCSVDPTTRRPLRLPKQVLELFDL